MRYKLFLFPLLAALASVMMTGCEDTESYSDMLKDEEKAVNWYLSNYRVDNDWPGTDLCETGDNAPFYRMDGDGFVYMQVIDKGDLSDKPKKGDKIYFLYTRYNIKSLYANIATAPNSNLMSGNLDECYFFLGDISTGNGLKFGQGLQLPMDFLGYHSEVNIILKSQRGFYADQSACLPYVANVKYLKPEY